VELFDALGWVMEPTLAHMFVDNVVMDLGTRTDRLTYQPGVIIEHRHPMAQKAMWDPSYRDTNASPAVARDRGRYERWRQDSLAADAATVANTVWKD